MSYPIQPGKVQAPALRDEILARTRLLEWLETKIHCRVLFVIADAGYGKTTLLADFSRRTRLRTIWYRLDDDDRDWVGFLSHLVAAGREHDPDFAPRTAAILRSLGPGGPTRDDAIEAFLGELKTIAPEGAALIFDDFHLADEVADVRHIAREIVTRAPERLSIVFASRRQPPVPVSKLRAIGELAELGIAELRFSDAELEQLFRETYGRPLEPDVLTELAARTEGWAASLTLVQAALRERSSAETRSFIRGLSGARDELHDYLAEEVVGDLPVIHQQFLMRTSVLQVVTPELAQVATGLEAVEVQSLMLESERQGLLGRRPTRRSAAQRYHPLVREFLEERLLRAVGAAAVRELHVAIARWADTTDWRTAAHHFAAAERWSDLQRVLNQHLETIVASGAFVTARDYVVQLPDTSRSATAHVVLSRAAAADGDFKLAAQYAAYAVELSPASDVVVGNLVRAAILQGRYSEATLLSTRLADAATSPLMRDAAIATRALLLSSVDGSLSEAIDIFERVAIECQALGLSQFEGVGWLNAALANLAAGRIGSGRTCSAKAIDALTGTGGPELTSAYLVEAAAIAMTGQIGEARLRFKRTSQSLRSASTGEYLVEHAQIEALFGSDEAARQLVAQGTADLELLWGHLLALIRGLLSIRSGAPHEAVVNLAAVDPDVPSTSPGFKSAIMTVSAIAQVIAGDTRAREAIEQALDVSHRQGAGLWHSVARLAMAALDRNLDNEISSVPEELRVTISMAAEIIAPRLQELGPDSWTIVASEGTRFKERWRPAIRRQIPGSTQEGLHAARLLDLVGDESDIAPLRKLARLPRVSPADKMLGRRLARALAAPVEVRDLGKVGIRVGESEISGDQVRRKVLALLSYLLTKPRWAGTREEVTEALWPDMSPGAAINSLNQTVYFLRRVFEPSYSEETTAGYLHQDSDLLWLDDQLISARSRRCLDLIDTFSRANHAADAVELADLYTGRFALDFAYEEWSSDFREWLHVGYLNVVETQVRADIDSGEFQRGISIARRALEVEPRNEELELSLLRLLRRAGAHSAAAEQYTRYANVLRSDLGVEPPAPESL